MTNPNADNEPLPNGDGDTDVDDIELQRLTDEDISFVIP